MHVAIIYYGYGMAEAYVHVHNYDIVLAVVYHKGGGPSVDWLLCVDEVCTTVLLYMADSLVILVHCEYIISTALMGGVHCSVHVHTHTCGVIVVHA